MCCNTCRKFTSTRWPLAIAILAAFCFLAPSTAFAETCQASASLPMFPQAGGSCATGLLPGNNLDTIVTVTNTSSTTSSLLPVAATLTGTVTITLAAGDAFVPVGGNGCVSNAAGVASCTAGAGTVLINMTAGGVALGAAASNVPIATIRTSVGGPAPAGCTVRGILGASGPADVNTNDALCSPQQSGSAGGSSSYREVQCLVAGDCPAATECLAPACVDNACGTTPVAATTHCGAADTECQTHSCDGAGVCATHNTAATTHCGAADTECQTHSCDGAGACATNNTPSTTHCGAADTECQSHSCDGAGACATHNTASTTHCGAADTECQSHSCDGAGTCATHNTASTTHCGAADTECQSHSCDGAGTCATNNTPSTTHCGAADTECQTHSCDGAGTCATNNTPSTTHCGAADTTCETNSCDGAGACQSHFTSGGTVCDVNANLCCTGSSADCTAACVAEACRTPGFWGTHGGTEKDNSINITSLEISKVGSLTICGETILPTDGQDHCATGSNVCWPHSPIEALCENPGHTSYQLQVVFQLTAAALNCVANGHLADCSNDTLFGPVFAACNTDAAVCAPTTDANKAAQAACVSALDCLNNGGHPGQDALGNFICANGTCSDNGALCLPNNLSNCATPGTATCQPSPNCEQVPLPGFDPPGAAGSSNACNDANKSACNIFCSSCTTGAHGGACIP